MCEPLWIDRTFEQELVGTRYERLIRAECAERALLNRGVPAGLRTCPQRVIHQAELRRREKPYNEVVTVLWREATEDLTSLERLHVPTENNQECLVHESRGL
jgi:hypothetical protein